MCLLRGDLNSIRDDIGSSFLECASRYRSTQMFQFGSLSKRLSKFQLPNVRAICFWKLVVLTASL